MNSPYKPYIIIFYTDEPIECYYYVCCRDGTTKDQHKSTRQRKNDLTKSLVEN